MMNFVFKTRNVSFKTRNVSFKTRNVSFKTMDFAEPLSRPVGRLCPLASPRPTPLAVAPTPHTAGPSGASPRAAIRLSAQISGRADITARVERVSTQAAWTRACAMACPFTRRVVATGRCCTGARAAAAARGGSWATAPRSRPAAASTAGPTSTGPPTTRPMRARRQRRPTARRRVRVTARESTGTPVSRNDEFCVEIEECLYQKRGTLHLK